MQYLKIVSFITVMSNKLVFLRFIKKTMVAERKEKLKVYY